MPSALDLLYFGLKTSLVLLCLLLVRGLVWVVNLLFIAPLFDPLRRCPGPEGLSFQQHFRELMDPNLSQNIHKEWVNAYGKTFRFHGFGRHDYRLMSFDWKSIAHILTTDTIYEKPWQTRSILAKLLGSSIFVKEGSEHKAHRKLITPAFTSQAVKAMSPVFFAKAEELRDIWDARIENEETETKGESAVVDILQWFQRATFDVIGLAGFDYSFHALQDESERMHVAYRQLFGVVDKGPGLKSILTLYFPWLDWVFPDTDARTQVNSLEVIADTGKKLIATKKKTILAEKAGPEDIREKDILSILLRANMASTSVHMSDSELLDQLSTFLFAGSDSTAAGMTWCFHLLSLHPEIQTRLREEIASVSLASTKVPTSIATSAKDGSPLTPPPSPRQTTSSLPSPPTTPEKGTPSAYSAVAHATSLDSLPLLDAVVRESLRLIPPIHGTIRVAMRDDLIPVSQPILMRDGTLSNHIAIAKGSFIHIPIEGLNTSEEVWGPDAGEFNPDRWFDLPSTARNPTFPGIANLMTFSFGPHACPGYRLTLLEMKVFLAVLLPALVFKPEEEIAKFNAFLTKPYVDDQWEHGARLPVRVSRVAP